MKNATLVGNAIQLSSCLKCRHSREGGNPVA